MEEKILTGKHKIVMCGTHEVGLNLVEKLLKAGINIDHFVLVDEKKARELNISGYVNFEPITMQYHIPIYYVDKYSLKSEKDLNFFKGNNFDLLIQGGWQRIFPKEILETLKIGAIGVHGSSYFLPKGRGRSPVNWSLIEGKKRFILQFFLLRAGIDDGDIFHYEMFDINEWDDCRTLYYKISILTAHTLIEFIPKLLSGQVFFSKQIGEPSYYPKRTPEDGLIDWSKSVFEIYNFIRALTHPYPGAFTFLKNQKVIIWKAQPFDTRIHYRNAVEGEVVELFNDGSYLVNCHEGLLLVKESTIIPMVGDIFNKK